MTDHLIVHDVILNVGVDDFEALEELRRGLVHSLQNIERMLGGSYAGTIEMFIPEPLWVS